MWRFANNGTARCLRSSCPNENRRSRLPRPQHPAAQSSRLDPPCRRESKSRCLISGHSKFGSLVTPFGNVAVNFFELRRNHGRNFSLAVAWDRADTWRNAAEACRHRREFIIIVHSRGLLAVAQRLPALRVII